MSISGRKPSAWIFPFLTLATCLLGAAERQGEIAGKSAYPLVRPDGRLVLLYRSSDRGLALSISSTKPGAPAGDAILDASPSVAAPVLKMDPAGSMGAVWERSGREGGTIVYGRFDGEAPASIRTIAGGADPLSSPDLDYDAAAGAWIAWVRTVNGKSFVCVAGLAEGKTWIVNGRLTASALQPRVLATPAQGIWVFWTGRDKGRDEIFAAAYRNRSWSGPMRLNKDDAVPHLGAAPALDANGFPWVAWSAYDGRAYRIYAASWDGEAWTAPETVSSGDGSDASPAAALVAGTTPLVVWSRAGRGSTALVGRFKKDGVWGPEIRLTPDTDLVARAPRLSVSGETISLAWETGENSRSRRLSFGELVAGTPWRAASLAPPPVLDPTRDENHYTGFGDSITYAENQGYLPRLEVMLRQRYGTSTLWNEGIGGETTVEGLARFDAAVAAHASRYLMLMEGTNDVIFGDISMDTTAFDLGEMSRRAVQAGVLPLLATIIPRKDWYWTTPVFQARIFDLNAKIRTRAAGQKIPLVDQFNVFYYYPTTDGGWQSLILPDGVHPNPKGFDVMAAAWLDGIKILPFPPSELRLARERDKVLFAERTYNVLRWRNNPKCETDQIAGFRIYRKERLDSAAAYQLAATFSFMAPVTDYRFLDANIVPGRTYSYVITALRKDGIEGPASVMVFDIP